MRDRRLRALAVGTALAIVISAAGVVSPARLEASTPTFITLVGNVVTQDYWVAAYEYGDPTVRVVDPAGFPPPATYSLGSNIVQYELNDQGTAIDTTGTVHGNADYLGLSGDGITFDTQTVNIDYIRAALGIAVTAVSPTSIVVEPQMCTDQNSHVLAEIGTIASFIPGPIWWTLVKTVANGWIRMADHPNVKCQSMATMTIPLRFYGGATYAAPTTVTLDEWDPELLPPSTCSFHYGYCSGHRIYTITISSQYVTTHSGPYPRVRICRSALTVSSTAAAP